MKEVDDICQEVAAESKHAIGHIGGELSAKFGKLSGNLI